VSICYLVLGLPGIRTTSYSRDLGCLIDLMPNNERSNHID
jgi:hypothetical protein